MQAQTSPTRRFDPATVFVVAAVLVFALGIVLPSHPYFWKIPRRDAGVFYYIGARILEGGVPYRDVWDHKPPLIFFINALGLWLGGGRTAGVWWLEASSLLATVIVGCRLLARNFGRTPAVLGSLAWLLGLVLMITGGNYPEEYALLLQFTALAVYDRVERGGGQGWRYALLGLTGGLAVLLKQNLVGVWLAVGVMLVADHIRRKDWRAFARRSALIALGGIVPMAFAAAYLLSSGAWSAFWDSAFVYNMAYSSAGAGGRGMYAAELFRILLRGGVAVPAAVGILASAVVGVSREKGAALKLDAPGAGHLLAVSLLALPLDAVLSGLSGRYFSHYYMTLLPPLAVLSAYGASVVLRRGKLAGTVLSLVTLVVGYEAVLFYMANLMLVVVDDDPFAELTGIVAFIDDNAEPDDAVLMWGAETTYNVLANRRSPTRFVYQYPLYTPGYASEAMMADFIADLQADPPALIIDAAEGALFVEPLDAEPDALHAPVVSYILAHYEAADVLPVYGWRVYRPRGTH